MTLAADDNQVREQANRPFTWRHLLGTIAGLALLGWLLSQVDLKGLWAWLIRADPWWLLVGGIAYLINNLIRSYRLVEITRLPVRRTPGMLVIVLAVSLANQILPARLGELTYVYLAHKSPDLSAGKGFASLLVARLFDLGAIGLLFLIGTLPQLDQLPHETVVYLWLAAACMGSVIAILVALVIWRQSLCRLAFRLVNLFKLPGRPTILRTIQDVETSLGTMSSSLLLGKTLVSSCAIWLSNFAMLYLLLISLDVSTTFSQTVIQATFAALTSIIPINSIGNFGTMEAGWAAGSILTGVDPDAAIMTGFAIHLLALGYAVALGLPAWGWFLWKGRGHNVANQSNPPEN